MGKRSERFSGKKLLHGLESHVGQEAQIILWQGKTFFGDLLDVEKDLIKLKDKNARWYNLKAHTHKLKLVDIREAIFDKTSKW